MPEHASQELRQWVKETAEHCEPSQVHWCDGSDQEYNQLCELLVQNGTFRRLNPTLRPNSYLAWSDPSDVARVEDRTFVCWPKPEQAGPNNNWMQPEEMKAKLADLTRGCMRGRTLYVIPFCMGPIGSPLAQYGVELSDSPYVAVNMKIMTRTGAEALKAMATKSFVRAFHSVGKPVLETSATPDPWPCNSEKYIVHFPQEQSIVSFGSGYGGNALLGKKCFALRIASSMGKDQNWLAEHMLILGVESPAGEKNYVTAAFPSACGKTNFAMLIPPEDLKGWKITTVGDDIAWLRFDEAGKLRAINPEAGFFGVAPGTSLRTNPNAIKTISANTIFTNVALTENGDVWWEGLTATPPARLTDWQGKAWTPDCGRPSSHPNARFTTPLSQCPSLDENFAAPQGVPISAIFFGGRRADTVPLVTQARSWQEGVFLAASIGSETTAAATGAVGVVRRDPMAMLPFCGYNMADYFAHWLQFAKNPRHQLPRIFLVNWFRKVDGKFAWPGYGENLRVLTWALQSLQSKASGRETWIGHSPTLDACREQGMAMDEKTYAHLFSMDQQQWQREIASQSEFFAKFGERLPKELTNVLMRLTEQVNLSPTKVDPRSQDAPAAP